MRCYFKPDGDVGWHNGDFQTWKGGREAIFTVDGRQSVRLHTVEVLAHTAGMTVTGYAAVSGDFGTYRLCSVEVRTRKPRKK